MVRTRILSILGVLIAGVPFVGLPYSWLMWILPVLGLAVVGVSFLLHSRKKKTDTVDASLPHDETPLA